MQERFPGTWEVLRQQHLANLASFMASRPALFPRRAADGLFYQLHLPMGVSPHMQPLPSPEAFASSAP